MLYYSGRIGEARRYVESEVFANVREFGGPSAGAYLFLKVEIYKSCNDPSCMQAAALHLLDYMLSSNQPAWSLWHMSLLNLLLNLN